MDYAIVPSNLNIQFVRGDEFGMLLDFDTNLSGYSFQTSIYEVGRVINGFPTSGGQFLTFSVTTVDAASGQINLSLTETQTQSFDLTKTYRWYLRWIAPGVVTRTVLSGVVSVGDP
jgi:hypothetical protein